MIIGISICGIITIMCDTNTINVTFYLLKVLHALKKKCGYCWTIQKIEGRHFIKSNYFLYFIPNNFLKKYLRVGTCPPWSYAESSHARCSSKLKDWFICLCFMFMFIPSWNSILQGDLNDPKPKPIETNWNLFSLQLLQSKCKTCWALYWRAFPSSKELYQETDGSLYSFVLSSHNQPKL